jgi:hypothetical protein
MVVIEKEIVAPPGQAASGPGRRILGDNARF